ncbi:MAG: hypothetical protein HOE83_19885 [Alphaproteobacteria bacterium]|nr:hypothetical protein [Alphaproteobacteria bacterium]
MSMLSPVQELCHGINLIRVFAMRETSRFIQEPVKEWIAVGTSSSTNKGLGIVWEGCWQGKNYIMDRAGHFGRTFFDHVGKIKQMSGWIFNIAYNALLTEIEGTLARSDSIPLSLRSSILENVVAANKLKPGYTEYVDKDGVYGDRSRRALDRLVLARSQIPEKIVLELRSQRPDGSAGDLLID